MSSNKNRQRRQPVSFTGRDGYLLLQALAYTILTIEALPESQQEWSNKEDMKFLLDELSHGYAGHFLNNARFHITGEGRPVPEITGWGENVCELARNGAWQ
jgi:hypothetical protein